MLDRHLVENVKRLGKRLLQFLQLWLTEENMQREILLGIPQVRGTTQPTICLVHEAVRLFQIKRDGFITMPSPVLPCVLEFVFIVLGYDELGLKRAYPVC